ncbi:Dihydroorotase [Paraliobacillus sp. PM-2]|uniref:dihydroorotase n=1 Tax=Paraliobacillus sp. PM-2 TaxID=1462524 RepID=UPI00061C2513|nr:dihydroorotase [Paraliobacillus sp. PM-2]CQR47765.1 Dihydroorotase [Paraliobacillus sp. PM-2]
MGIIIKNVNRLLSNNALELCQIRVSNGVISEIAPEVKQLNDEVIIDGKGHIISSGFIDVHVHLREPGGEAKETIETGTKAAAKGGYTTICAMPNTNPVPDDKHILEWIGQRIDQSATVNVLPYASITKGLNGEKLSDMKELKEAGAFAFTDDGVGIQTADQMYQAMQQAAALDMAIVAHCEDNSLIHSGVMHEGLTSKKLKLNGIPSICESTQIARDVLLAEATGCHYHVCHVSTKESVRVIRDAKRAGIRVTAEVTPHHLLLNECDITEVNSNYKMNPPLRSKEDQQALLIGLLDGTIDFIATDHAPHTEEEKARGMNDAPFGIVGLETAFPLLYTHLVKTNVVTLKQLLDWLTIKPAQVFGMKTGELEVGNKADLTILDITEKWDINKNNFLSKGRNTPFDKWEVTGKPLLTIVEGEIVFKEDNNV